MDQFKRWQSSTTATYRFPLWWPPEMVVVPTTPKESRDQVMRRAVQWMNGVSARSSSRTPLGESGHGRTFPLVPRMGDAP